MSMEELSKSNFADFNRAMFETLLEESKKNQIGIDANGQEAIETTELFKKVQACALANMDAMYCYYVAVNIKGADKVAFARAVANKEDAFYCCNFLTHVKGLGCAKEALEDVVLKSGNAELCYKIIKKIWSRGYEESADRWVKAIIESRDPQYCYMLAADPRNLKLDLNEIQDIILESKSSKYCYFLAQNVRGVDINKLQQVIVENKDAEHSWFFLRDVKGADSEPLIKVILEDGRPEYCYKAAWGIGKDCEMVHLLEDAVIAAGDASYCIDFALTVKGADLKKFERFFEELEVQFVGDDDRLIKKYSEIVKGKRKDQIIND